MLAMEAKKSAGRGSKKVSWPWKQKSQLAMEAKKSAGHGRKNVSWPLKQKSQLAPSSSLSSSPHADSDLILILGEAIAGMRERRLEPFK